MILPRPVAPQGGRRTPSDEIAGSGKGAFKLLKEEPCPENGIEFKFNSDLDVVIVYSWATTVRRSLSAKRKENPGSQIAYHTITPSSCDPDKATLAQTHRVAFIPGEPSSEVCKTNIAIKPAKSKWMASNLWRLSLRE